MKHIRNPITAVLILAMTVLVAGCAKRSYSERDFIVPNLDKQMTIAVLPLENLTNHPSAGVIVSQMLATEFYKQKLFKLEEGSRIRNWIKEQNIDIDKLAEKTYAHKVAEDLGVDAVLIGSVNEYGYQHGLHEEPTVGFGVRLIDAENGDILWASNHATVGRGYIGRESVSKTAQDVVERMIKNLMEGKSDN